MSGQGLSNYDIWVMNADGSGQPINVSNHADWDAYPAWSPLGDLIAFSSLRDGGPDVHVVAPTGGPVTNVTGYMISVAIAPTWSPAANFIAFQSDSGGNEDLLYFEPGWQFPILLTTSATQDIQPSWGGGN
jgi:TolB protein